MLTMEQIRAQELNYIERVPYYGRKKEAQKLYETIKKHFNVLQVGICGYYVTLTSKPEDSEAMETVLGVMFPNCKSKQITNPYTGYIATFINWSKKDNAKN